jgi:hypothetical protein
MMVRICSQVIKTIAREVSEPLSRLSNLTCLTGTIPHDLKIALLTPNFKANENNEFKNYRPISIHSAHNDMRNERN